MRTVRPPMRPGSTDRGELDRAPVISPTRAPIAASSAGSSGSGARDGRPRRCRARDRRAACTPRRPPAAIASRPRWARRRVEVAAPAARRAPSSSRVEDLAAGGERDRAGCRRPGATSLADEVRGQARGRRRQRVEASRRGGRARTPPRRSGGRRSSGGPSAAVDLAGPRSRRGTPRRAGAGARRSSSRRRPGRRRRGPGRRPRPAGRPWRALLLGLDLGGGADAHPLELLARRGDVRVAASPGRRFWARSRISLASRRASAIVVGRGGLPARSRSRAPARRPGGPARSAPGARRACRLIGLNANGPEDREEEQEVEARDDDPEEVDRRGRRRPPRPRAAAAAAPSAGRERPGGPRRAPSVRLAGYLMKMARRPTTTARTPRPSANAARMIAGRGSGRPRRGCGRSRCVGHAGQDADADAGADDAEGREAGAEVLHGVASPPPARPSTGRWWDRLDGPAAVRRRPGGRRRCWAGVRRGGFLAQRGPPPASWPSIAARVNMRVRTLKMSAWTKLSRSSRPMSATGMIAMVRAVMTPSATSPP